MHEDYDYETNTASRMERDDNDDTGHWYMVQSIYETMGHIGHRYRKEEEFSQDDVLAHEKNHQYGITNGEG